MDFKIVGSPGDGAGDSVWTTTLHLATELHPTASFEPEIVDTFGGGVWRAIEHHPEHAIILFNAANNEVKGSRAELVR